MEFRKGDIVVAKKEYGEVRHILYLAVTAGWLGLLGPAVIEKRFGNGDNSVCVNATQCRVLKVEGDYLRLRVCSYMRIPRVRFTVKSNLMRLMRRGSSR
jgi:hypothetical protein